MKSYIAQISEDGNYNDLEVSFYAKSHDDAKEKMDKVFKGQQWITLFEKNGSESCIRTMSRKWLDWTKVFEHFTLEEYCSILVDRLKEIDVNIKDDITFSEIKYNPNVKKGRHISEHPNAITARRRDRAIQTSIYYKLMEDYIDRDADETAFKSNKKWYKILDAETLLCLSENSKRVITK